MNLSKKLGYCVLSSGGRPIKVNPSGERFLKLYLDPVQTPQQICRTLKIGLSTFYKYENELNLPKLRVAFGTTTGDLPVAAASTRLRTSWERRELAVLRAFAPFTGARIKLVPTQIINFCGERLVKKKQVDFVLSSLSWTRGRAKDFYCSNNYDLENSPSGVLIALKNGFPHTRIGTPRPRLAVVRNLIHCDYAETSLIGEFSLVRYRNTVDAFKALQEYQVDVVLAHPSFLDYLPDVAAQVRVISKPYCYGSFSTMLFHEDSHHWLPVINRALTVMHERKLIAPDSENPSKTS